ncbi:TetR/AcrR family transcriptional regulator [Dactylosporangium sp. CS-033363]|uniref:TetR/AcrR family transcriptional regulator n=1 Tax=Dactylosporangium sp. CS-033363 TaxID=3239935 RepID=UPI003D9184B0
MQEGNAEGSSTPGRTGRPPRTSRAQILAAARTVIDRDGWEKLTIRRLAAEVGVGTMTLYHHVRDREDLLVQLLNEHVENLTRPELPAVPRDRIVVAALAMREALAAWPWGAEVVTTDGFVARLSDSALWMVEAIVAGAADHGCTPEQSVDVFRHLWYYTVGEVLVRARSRGVTLGTGGLAASQHPQLAAIGERWASIAARDIYPEGVRAFVDGLLAKA